MSESPGLVTAPQSWVHSQGFRFMRYECGPRICISNKSPKMLRPQFEKHHLGLTLPDFFFFLQSFLIIITIIIIILAFSKHVWHKQSSFTLKKPDSSRKYLQKKWINTGKLFIFSMKLLQHPRTDIEKSLASPYWSCSSLEGDEMGLQRLPLGQGYCWTLPSWEWPDNVWSPAGPRLSWFFSLLGWYGS